MHCLTSAIPSTSTPIALKEDEEPLEDASSQQWLESMEDVVVPGDDSLMAPLLPQAPGSKSRIRTTMNWEKKSAWKHWHQNIIYQVVGIYLKVEGKRANNAPLPIPAQTVFTEDHRLQTTNRECCNSCQSPYEFHSIETINFSC